MILLGKIENREVALRFSMKNAPECYYEIRLLGRGTIERLIGRKASKIEPPIRYNGAFEREFENLKPYTDKKERDYH